MEQILTIAIPTYNHHDFLLNQLNNLIPQLTDEISFFILDNHSVPPVTDYLELNNFTYKKLKIIRNSINIGGDANILKCLRLSETKWVWVLSDNDIILSDAVITVLKLIKSNPFKVFISLGNNKDEEICGIEDLFRKLNYPNSFTISNSIYNMGKLYNYLNYYEKSISTHQGQILFVLKYFEKNSKSEALQIRTKIFSDSLPAAWSKLAFIEDSLYISKFIEAKYFRLFNRTIGIQIWQLLMFLAIIGRCYEQMSICDYLKVYIKLLKYFNIFLFLKRQFWSLNLWFLISLFSKQFYPDSRKKNNQFQHEFSTKSKSTKWGITN